MSNLSTIFKNRHLAVMLFLGFASGLPLTLTSSTLQAWFTVANVDLIAIGLLGLASQPYLYKFFWAPLFDRYSLPFLDRRRSWIFVTQITLFVLLVIMACLDPQQHAFGMGILALMIAFASASQDIVADAYRTDILSPNERGTGAALYMGGYRVAMLVSGGLALIVADYLGWSITYLSMAALMIIGMIATWFAPPLENNVPQPTSLLAAVIDPLREIFSRSHIFLVLLFVLIYKFGDQMIFSMVNTFLLRALGFSLTVVGTVINIGGTIATILGVFIAGLFVNKFGLYRSLLLLGACQLISNFNYLLLAWAGQHYWLMVYVIIVESIASGMTTVAFIAFLMSLCDHRYTATQFALLSGISAVGRVFGSPLAGYIVEQCGWEALFYAAVGFAAIGLMLLYWLRKTNKTFTFT